MLEHGAYTLLLDYYYADEKPLPLDAHELYIMVRAMRPEDRKAVDKVIAMFFTKWEDGHHQKRVDHEIEVSQQARENGGRGGRRRSGLVTGNETGTLTGLGTGSVTEEVAGSGHPPTTNHQPSSTTNKLSTKTSKAPGRPVEIPDWMPVQQWEAFLEMRQRIRKPATAYAQKMLISKLSELKDQGHHPAAVLGQSIMNSWQGIFPLKEPVRVA